MLGTIKIILNTLNSNLKIKFYLLIFFGIISAFLEMIGVATIIPIIKIILSPEDFVKLEIVQHFLQKYELIILPSSLAYIFIFLAIIFFIIKAIFLIFAESFNLKFVNKVSIIYSNKLYSNYIFSDIKKFNNFKFSEKIKNIGQVGYILSFLRSANTLFIDSILCIILLIFLFNFNFKFTFLMLLVFLIFSILVIFYSQGKLVKLSKIKVENTQKTYENLLNILNSLKEVIILKRRSVFQKKFNQNIQLNILAGYRQDIIKFIPKIIIEILVLGIVLSLIAFFLFKQESIVNNLDFIGVYIVAIFKMAPACNRILLSIQNLKTAIFPAQEILDEIKYLSLEDKNLNHLNDDVHSEKLNFNEKISIKNVSFSYSGAKKNVIKDFNLEIKKNSIIGICGPSGEGKTTFINVLLGFNKPNTGKVYVDNYDIYKNLKSWQNLIGYVPQDIYLLNDTIKNNILFGLEDTKVDTKKFNKLLKDCNLDKFINDSENGLNTIIGERAAKISGGQAQRICIARALMNDSNILILDEGTSKLDQKNENEIIENLIKNFKSKLTMIIISHRVDMLNKFCNNVYTIKNNQLKILDKNEK